MSNGWRPAVQWWIWLVVIVVVIAVGVVAVLAVQARRRAGGVIVDPAQSSSTRHGRGTKT
jgi:hypothetical protein